jgi:transposase
MRKVYLAIDAHARHSVLGCMDARGNYERSWRFRTCESELIRHVEGVGEAKKLLAIEEGPLAFWMAQTLSPYVAELVIADPHENALISRRANKSDKVDVRSLCRLLRLGELKHVYHPTEDERAIFKAAVQQYLAVRDQAVMLQNQIKAKYRAWGVLDVVGTDRVYSEEGRKEFLAQIKVRPVRNQVSRLYVLLDTTRRVQKLALEEAIRLGRKYPEIAEFRKIPGIAHVNALVFDAYIQTPDRFTRKSALYRYCRLGVTDRSSDNKPLGYKRLDKAGNSELKVMSYRAFVAAMHARRPNEVHSYYERSVRDSRDRTCARLNTQRKIISVMHGVWRKGEAYRPELFSRN